MSTAVPANTDAAPAAAGSADAPARGAYWSVILLLGINLFNYVDRQVLSAVEAKIEDTFHITQAQMGWAATAFLLSYMVISPIFGWLADRMSRWVIVAIGVIVWSLASGGTGLAGTFAILLITRCFVGVGEAAYGPVAPTILSDLYPVKHRGRILSWFYLAIPVGSALGYVLGGMLYDHFHDWRPAFYAVVPPGILLGIWAVFMKDPKPPASDVGGAAGHKATLADYKRLIHNRSYVLDTLGMAAMTFAIGGIAFWMPKYVFERLAHEGHPMSLGKVNFIFGAISAGGGLVATLAGGITGDALRKKFSGSYFLVSGIAMIVGFPLLLGMLWVPFPFAWVLLSAAVFCLFFNTGPTNTALANVTHPAIRATAFAVNIFVIHLLGDAASPPLIGKIADMTASPTNPTHGLNVAFTVVSFFILLGGVLWLWGAKYLGEDTANAPHQLDRAERATVGEG
jgi:MFS family permease